MESMFDLIQKQSLVRDDDNAVPLEVNKGSIEFKNVSFEYEKNQPVLRNLSFKVEGGQTVAFVGPTGSGKSTILKMVMRLYDPTSGSVQIDGQNVAQVTQKSLRQAITTVPQDCLLFNDTIDFNIRYGRLNATEHEVKEAAKLAQLHDIIEKMHSKYQTVVNERGQRLSGGERQRLSFARAILKRSKITILDEATSSLDQLTESKIQQSLRNLKQDSTMIMVAHRLCTVKDADLIVVLKDGQIVEQGSHWQLTKNRGLYFEMWNRQLTENITQKSSSIQNEFSFESSLSDSQHSSTHSSNGFQLYKEPQPFQPQQSNLMQRVLRRQSRKNSTHSSPIPSPTSDHECVRRTFKRSKKSKESNSNASSNDSIKLRNQKRLEHESLLNFMRTGKNYKSEEDSSTSCRDSPLKQTQTEILSTGSTSDSTLKRDDQEQQSPQKQKGSKVLKNLKMFKYHILKEAQRNVHKTAQILNIQTQDPQELPISTQLSMYDELTTGHEEISNEFSSS